MELLELWFHCKKWNYSIVVIKEISKAEFHMLVVYHCFDMLL